MRSNATEKYNCHSYAWYRQSTANDLWIDLDEAMKYMTDGSYQVVGRYSASAGYPTNASGKVFYQTMEGTSYVDDHSGYLYRASKK